MKGMMNLIAGVCLLAIPLAGECKTVAYSPSTPGQPLIFHYNTDNLQVSQLSDITWVQIQNALLIQSGYSQHLDNLAPRNCCAPWNVWAEGMGQWQQQCKGHQHQFGYNATTGGLTLGVDTCCNDFIVGAAASYTNTDLRWKQSSGSNQINSYYGGLYGRWDNGCLYVNASVLGAYSDYHTTRHLHLGRVDRHGHFNHNSGEALAGIETGLLFQNFFCSMDLTPFVAVNYVYLSQEGYREHRENSSDLNVRSHNDQLIQSELGLQFNRRMQCTFCNRNWIVDPNFAVSYINQTPLTGHNYRLNFVSSENAFGVNGWNYERNLGSVAFNFNFSDCTETVNVTLHYDGQFGENYWNQTASLMCNLCF